MLQELGKLPKYFLENLKNIYSAEEIEKITKWFQSQRRPLTLRVNTSKITLEDFEAEMENKKISFEKVAWLKSAYILHELQESDLQKMRLYDKWEVYLQGLSSQLPIHFFNELKAKNVLDAASAPGWKTSQMSAIMHNTWSITALELHQVREDKLEYTLNKQGSTNVEMIKTDARIFESQTQFDAILFDAPCSSEGRINLNREKSYGFLSDSNNKKNYKIQKSIISNILKYLADEDRKSVV